MTGRRKRRGSGRLFEQERKLPWPADGSFRPGDLAGGVEAEIRNPLHPFLDRDPHFHARKVGADATVNAEAEPGMAVFLSPAQHLLAPSQPSASPPDPPAPRTT